jgi:PAS domain-containing protein
LSVMECPERMRLTEEYSRLVTDYAVCLEAIKRLSGEPKSEDWQSVETALAESHEAWRALEGHISWHKCLGIDWPAPDPAHASSQVLGQAAAAALDAILVADDHRRFVDVNEAAASILGLPRNEIVGRSIDEFFSLSPDEPIPAAWDRFVAEGVQCGLCELKTPGRRRRFEYRAKANFASGLHLSVLREQSNQ